MSDTAAGAAQQGVALVADTSDPANALFAEFCLPYASAAASEAAVVASGRFEPVSEILIGRSTRYATYPLLGMDRAGITLVTGSVAGLQCSVGVNNAGPNLYEDGRVTVSGL